jgi:hypothetical protein
MGVLLVCTKLLSSITTARRAAAGRARCPASCGRRCSGTWLHQQPAKAASKVLALQFGQCVGVHGLELHAGGHGALARATARVSGLMSVASQCAASRAPCGVHQPVPQATSSTRRPAKCARQPGLHRTQVGLPFGLEVDPLVGTPRGARSSAMHVLRHAAGFGSDGLLQRHHSPGTRRPGLKTPSGSKAFFRLAVDAVQRRFQRRKGAWPTCRGRGTALACPPTAAAASRSVAAGALVQIQRCAPPHSSSCSPDSFSGPVVAGTLSRHRLAPPSTALARR